VLQLGTSKLVVARVSPGVLVQFSLRPPVLAGAPAFKRSRFGKKSAGRSIKKGCTARFNVTIEVGSDHATIVFTQPLHVDAAGLPCHDHAIRLATGLAGPLSQECKAFVALQLALEVPTLRIIARGCCSIWRWQSSRLVVDLPPLCSVARSLDRAVPEGGLDARAGVCHDAGGEQDSPRPQAHPDRRLQHPRHPG
jgi:hypothetical protein